MDAVLDSMVMTEDSVWNEDSAFVDSLGVHCVIVRRQRSMLIRHVVQTGAD